MLKNGIKVINKKGLHYIVEDRGNLLKFKPWLGDAFSFLYDFIMKHSIFPKKFGGDMNRHYEILSKDLQGVHEKRVLELATGSGSAGCCFHLQCPSARAKKGSKCHQGHLIFRGGVGKIVQRARFELRNHPL